MTEPDRIEQALTLGEVGIALSFADDEVRVARKKGTAEHLAALRRRARIGEENADDEDRDDLARVARAYRDVAKHEEATAADFEALAWAEALASAPRKAKSALVAAARLDPERSYDSVRAAVGWVTRRDDETFAALIRAADGADDVALERSVRLVVQAHRSGVEIARRLCASRRAALPVWDRRVARAVNLLAGAYRVTDDPASAVATLASWVEAVDAALPDREDARRLVAAGARLIGAPQEQVLAARESRLRRAAAVFGEKSPALEAPLFALAGAARQAGAHAVAVLALRQLDPILAAKRGQDALFQRHCALIDLRSSLLMCGRYDEALDVVRLEEEVGARRGHLQPDHGARAEVFEARGDVNAWVAECLARVAQYEAGPPPAYGRDASNTERARDWARQALAKAGRAGEADDLLGEKPTDR